jgi:hypothetical protein
VVSVEGDAAARVAVMVTSSGEIKKTIDNIVAIAEACKVVKGPPVDFWSVNPPAWAPSAPWRLQVDLFAGFCPTRHHAPISACLTSLSRKHALNVWLRLFSWLKTKPHPLDM